MKIFNKNVIETDNFQQIKYYLFGACYLSKTWLYTQRTVRFFGILIGKKHYCYKQYIPNAIRYNQIIGKSEHFTTNKTIDIIIPVYNGYEYLKPLLDSIYKNTDLKYRLFVIDDCSPDERVFPFLQKQLKKFGENAKLFKNEKNMGFVKTVNFGFSKTQNHVVLLNTDIVVPRNWLSRLMAPIFKNNQVASVTPFSNGGTIYSFPEQNINNPLISNYQNIDDCLINLKMTPENTKKLVFPTGVGFCMAINRDALNCVGYLDEKFGRGYGEENDWSMRAFNMGYFHTVAYNLFVWHNQGGSFSHDDTANLLKSNHKILTKKHPHYLKLIFKSSSNPFYQSIMFVARLLVFSKYSKQKIVIFDSDNTHDINKKDTLLLVVKYTPEIESFTLTQQYNQDKHTIVDTKLSKILDFINNIKFDEIVLDNNFGHKTQTDNFIRKQNEIL